MAGVEFSCYGLTPGRQTPNLALQRPRPAVRKQKETATKFGEDEADIQGHPKFPLATGQTNLSSVRLTIMTLAWSTSDRAKALGADGEHSSMARRNRAEVVVADEVGVYHCVQRVVRRAFLCGIDPLSGNPYGTGRK